MPKVKSLSERLAAQQKKIQEAEEALIKIKQKEMDRLFAIFESEGLFDADVPDDMLRDGVKEIIKKASSTTKSSQTLEPA